MNTTEITETEEAPFLLPIPHPGDTLRLDFLEPLGLSYYAVARAIGTTPITLSMIARCRRSISPEMAMRLGRYFGTSAEFWNNLQTDYDLRVAQREKQAAICQRVIPLDRAA